MGLLSALLVSLVACQNSSHTVPGSGEDALLDLSGTENIIVDSLEGVERVIQLSTGVLALVEHSRPTLTIVNPSDGTLARFGREGGGPGEFRFPGEVVLLPGDTIGVPDKPGSRLHLFTGEGEYIRTAPLPSVLFLETILFSDHAGYLYAVLSNRRRPTTVQATDSTKILRFRPGQTEADSVWTIPAPRMGRFSTGDGGFLVMPVPFSPVDAFGTSSNGLMWRILGSPGRVDTKRVGEPETAGDEWLETPEAVRQRDRDSVLEEYGHSRWPNVRLTFNSSLPLFLEARVAPWGEAWVQMRKGPESRTHYAVYDSTGSLIRQVLLRESDRIVGFGTGEALLLREDERGFQTLYRVSIR